MNSNELQKLSEVELEAVLVNSFANQDWKQRENLRRAIFHEKGRRRLVAAAARATEHFSEDELEAFAERKA